MDCVFLDIRKLTILDCHCKYILTAFKNFQYLIAEFLMKPLNFKEVYNVATEVLGILAVAVV